MGSGCMFRVCGGRLRSDMYVYVCMYGWMDGWMDE